MFQRGWFVVEVGDARLSKQIVRVVQRYGVVRASAVDDASVALLREPQRVAGAVVSVAGDALEIVARIRSNAPALPVLVLLRSPESETINRLQSQGVEVSCLPLHLPSLVSFTQRALAAAFLPHDGVARVVAQLARDKALSSREVQLLSYALADDPRGRVRRRLGVEENTLKTQIRVLLRKCQARNLDALAKNILREALVAKSGGATHAGSYAAPRVELAQSA